MVARQFYLTSEGIIWYSKIGKYESVPAFNYIPIRTESGDSPVRIIDHFGGLLVFFEQSIWYIDLQSADPIYWVPRKLNADFGSPYIFSITKGKLPNQQVGIFYLAEDKSVRVLTGVGSDQVQLFDNIYTDRLSMPIEVSLMADETDPDDIYMTFFEYKLYLSISGNVFVWDSQLGEWTKYDYPVNQTYIGFVDDQLAIASGNVLMVEGEEFYDSLISSNVDISWNYTTQIFADKYELYSDFDKLWIRGEQESDAPIVISFNCNGNDSSYSDYVNATLTGDATINTDEHGLLGAGGRDIQLNISGEDYIRVDDLSIRRSTRED
jgi:hypothetical protein